MEYFLSVLGLVLVIEGFPYFCFPDKVKLLAEKIKEIEDRTLRVFGFILMIVGLMVLFITKR